MDRENMTEKMRRSVGPWFTRYRCAGCVTVLSFPEIYRGNGTCPHCGRASRTDIADTVTDTVREIRDRLRPWWAFWRGPRLAVRLEEATYSEVGAVYDADGDLLGHLGTVVRDGISAFVWPVRNADPYADWEDKYIHHRIERRDGRWTCPPGTVRSVAARRQWTPARRSTGTVSAYGPAKELAAIAEAIR